MPDNSATVEPSKKPRRRWFRVTPDRLMIGLLGAVCLLWLSERFQWFGFNHHKGWTVLIAVATVGVAIMLMLLWWIASLLFHWRFQFGIRSLLVLVVACSVAVGWFATAMRQARSQADLVARHSRVWLMQDDSRYPQAAKFGWLSPAWLRELLGINFFTRLVLVDCFGDRTVSDSDLASLESMEDISILYIGCSAVDDAGLDHLTGLRRLQNLDVQRTRIGDIGVAKIAGLPELVALRLSLTTVTDLGIMHLRGMTKLRFLYLESTEVSESGVRELQKALPNCRIFR